MHIRPVKWMSALAALLVMSGAWGATATIAPCSLFPSETCASAVTGVVVGGTTYDVSFAAGTFTDLNTGGNLPFVGAAGQDGNAEAARDQILAALAAGNATRVGSTGSAGDPYNTFWVPYDDPINAGADIITKAAQFTGGSPTWFAFNGLAAVSSELAYAIMSVVPVPAAVDDGPVSVTEGVAEIIPVGTNDTGFTDPVTVTVTTLPTKGTIGAISPTGPAAGMTITYTANIGTVGADSFDYEMTDGTPASDTATVTVDISPDTDGDGVPDGSDNCTLVSNASQCDSDADGYGNRCDGDLNNNSSTNSQDYVLFRQQLGQPSVAPIYNQADINCNSSVNSQDYVLFRSLLGQPSGPSGLVP